MFKGSIVALVTPMHNNGAIDYQALQKLLDLHIQSKTDAVVLLGSTGEASLLTLSEKKEIVEKSIEYTQGRIKILVGANANGTEFTIELCKEFQDVGVEGLLLSTPSYIKPTRQGLINHFNNVSQAIDLPVIIYNVPSRSACDVLPDVIIELSNIENIVGVKEASGDIARIAEIASSVSSDFAILSGEDYLNIDVIRQGGHGSISVTANIAPKLHKEAIDNALNGNFDEAMSSWSKLTGLNQKLFVESNPIPVKWLLAKMGLIHQVVKI